MESKMCVRIWLEVGHACEPRLVPLGRAPALDWRVWVRGVAGANISTFVQKVVFHLHPDTLFAYPKRVLQEPPYEIEESGSASIEIPIDIYLKFSTKPRRIQLKYSLSIANIAQSSSESRCIYYDFENPSEQLRLALMRGGGELIGSTGAQTYRSSLVILSDSRKDRSHSHHKSSKQKKPIQNKPVYEKTMRFDDGSECANSRLDFMSSLRQVSMTEDEIRHVSHMYLAHSSYEKSDDALPLPPLSDPIYCIPELPASLRHALASSVEIDYVLQ